MQGISTFNQCHAMLQKDLGLQIGRDITRVPVVTDLLAFRVYKEAHDVVKHTIMSKSVRSMEVDSQSHTAQDCYDAHEYKRIICAWFEEGKSTSDRFLAMGTWMHSSVGRGDEVRGYYLTDILKPLVLHSVGESHLRHMYLAI
jgi:hypothetical protein